MAPDKKNRLAKLFEELPVVRKRFRKGAPWVREPGDAMGDNPMQTTRALELNYPIVATMIRWSDSRKVAIGVLEPQARDCLQHRVHCCLQYRVCGFSMFPILLRSETCSLVLGMWLRIRSKHTSMLGAVEPFFPLL